MTNDNAKCYTFYSYKGGSGRSTTCINTLIHLISELCADPEHPILLVDSDLESAGLTFFFGMEKKFDDLGLHTTKLLQNASSQFDESEINRIFGTNLGKKTSVPTSILNRIKTIFPKYDVNELFNGFGIYEKEQLILNSIVTRTERIENKKKFPHIEDKITVKKYNLKSLLNTLNNKQVVAAPEEKSKIVADFLPTTSFVDVSEFFGAQYGTVLFLGVDVNYVGKSVEFYGTADAISALLQECSNRNFRAVVFDSSAGVQSSADALHRVSDVLVYCMRPSRQFVAGTMTQLSNYSEELENSQKESIAANPSREGKKSVIVLPTAVPPSVISDKDVYSYDSFRGFRFEDIAKNILITYSQIVDNSFCQPDTALNEVEAFKWYEMILGSRYLPDYFKNESGIFEVLKCLADPEQIERFPDAKRAYDIYKKLAKKLVANS